MKNLPAPNAPKDMRQLNEQLGEKTKSHVEANIVPMEIESTSEKLGKKITKSETLSTSPPKESPSAKLSPPLHPSGKINYPPETIYYHASKGHFLVNLGQRFRTFSKRKPVHTGLSRYVQEQTGASKRDADEEAKELLDSAEVDRAVDWCGAIAGYPSGLHHDHKQMTMLITEGPMLVNPSPGDCPLLDSVFTQAFPVDDARTVFLGWLAQGIDAVRKNTHQAAPMMVLAGPIKAGKSLIAWIAQQCLGGRIANPSTAWTGTLPWNDDLAASELLLIDDNRASTDIRDRRNLGARFKESIYAPAVTINKRNSSSLSLRPVWRVLICCNETPENLSVIPPLDTDNEDKISLLQTFPVSLPVDTSSPEGKTELQQRIRTELPAFLHKLQQLQIPDHLHDSRSGVRAWKDKILLARLHQISPEGQLESIIRQGGLDLSHDGQWLTAAEVRNNLIHSSQGDHARDLLKSTTCTGRYLARLIEQKSEIVTDRRTYQGTNQYLITLSHDHGGEVE